MAKRRRKTGPRVTLGRLHLTVADLDRSVAFYESTLGFEVTRPTPRSAAVRTAGGDPPRILLTATETGEGAAAGGCRFALEYPARNALADALVRIEAAGVPIDRATRDAFTESLFVRDPDGNRLELFFNLPREDSRPAEEPATQAIPLDLDDLRSAIGEGVQADTAARAGQPQPLTENTRSRLRDMRVRLLNLHKVLLEDARTAYEMDRGRIGSNANLLQLVISDPWFAWLHPLSELVVRIDETLQADAPATEVDGAALLDHVARLLSPEQGPDEFARRYYEALQRQPAVIVAHAEVRRILKQAR
jgi:catechol 2,3-dioxygenase-like lactoylglutathione lyase family enzyme